MSAITEQASLQDQMQQAIQGPLDTLSEHLGQEVKLWSTWLQCGSSNHFGPIVAVSNVDVLIELRGTHDSNAEIKLGSIVPIEFRYVQPFQTR